MATSTAPHRHTPVEDLAALALGCLFVALGSNLYAEARILTGGTVGLSLLLHQVTGISFGAIFFVTNLPFYWVAARRMGWRITLRTFVAVGLVSLLSRLTPLWIGFEHLNPIYASVTGGGLFGIGMLIMVRHRIGLGGVNILALYLQERHGIRAGYFQLAVDLTIMLAACFVLQPVQLALSVLGVVVLNLIIAMNHRPGRYVALS
ncbi:YitT family protein [Rhodovarius lipocyclicus]|uniref:YitT family protein n=1 Tax=Rhodovarius lipocyclicus TaxID=268410 RepID=UPI00135B7A89|nr:YitT family protein [Rhodovarius lipocyclicus]